MARPRLHQAEIAFVGAVSLALLAWSFRMLPVYPSSEINPIEVVGEAAIALAFLVMIGSIYRFRESLDQDIYHPLMIGVSFLYLSTLQDFIDELVVVTNLLTYTVENAGGALGAVGLVVAFGLWVNQYETRGQVLTQQEERLRHRTNQLKMLNRILHHDIRNDLNVIAGRIQLAMDHVDADGEVHLEKAHRSTNDAISVTETAKEFIDALDENENRELEPIPLRDVLQNQIDRVRESHPDAEISVETLPQSEIHVMADDMVASIFRNLLVNAVQHNNKDVPAVNLSVTTHQKRIVVTVADNGPGIPEEVREQVFERDKIGLESSGTGIGLYIVKKLTSQYGGDVWITNNEPDGTIFNLELQRSV